jgi:hypothetical protein
VAERTFTMPERVDAVPNGYWRWQTGWPRRTNA